MPPAKGVRIRAREQEDLPACVRTLRAVHDHDRYPMYWPDDPGNWLRPPSIIAAWVATGPSGSRADHGQQVLGHICVVSDVGADIAALTGFDGDQLAGVSRLFVAPGARGHGLGLGGRLLDRARTWAAGAGRQLVLDVVDERSPAVALYERQGWRRIGDRVASWTREQDSPVCERLYLQP
ncbi:MAG TPA: GNAT family N-acetyltransferase [Beutenbergiaceae bacterium]|nr:GNAT family N-acetyltransferase [Beutenbergiaceae bacterium]